MPFRVPKLPKPGEQLSSSELRKFFDEASRVLNLNAIPPLFVRRGTTFDIGLDDDPFFPAKITGKNYASGSSSGSDSGSGSGSGPSLCPFAYSWFECVPDECGDLVAKPFGRSGHLSSQPAFELNKNEHVEDGTFVWMRRGYSDVTHGLEYLFKHDAGKKCTDYRVQLADMKCNKTTGKFEKYVSIIYTEDGCLKATEPIFAGNEGCCGCPDDTGGSGIGGGGSGTGSTGDGGGTGNAFCGCPDMPTTLCAVLSFPTCPGLDGKTVTLMSPAAGGCDYRGGVFQTQFCYFLVGLKCCAPGTSCSNMALSINDPSGLCSCGSNPLGIFYPSACSCGPPFMAVYDVKFRTVSSGIFSPSACFCPPPAGSCDPLLSTCEHSGTITVMTCGASGIIGGGGSSGGLLSGGAGGGGAGGGGDPGTGTGGGL